MSYHPLSMNDSRGMRPYLGVNVGNGNKTSHRIVGDGNKTSHRIVGDGR